MALEHDCLRVFGRTWYEHFLSKSPVGTKVLDSSVRSLEEALIVDRLMWSEHVSPMSTKCLTAILNAIVRGSQWLKHWSKEVGQEYRRWV